MWHDKNMICSTINKLSLSGKTQLILIQISAKQSYNALLKRYDHFCECNREKSWLYLPQHTPSTQLRPHDDHEGRWTSVYCHSNIVRNVPEMSRMAPSVIQTPKVSSLYKHFTHVWYHITPDQCHGIKHGYEKRVQNRPSLEHCS